MAITSAGVLIGAANPGDEAAPKRAGVERGQDVAQMIVRRRAALAGAEPAQKLDLPLAEPSDVCEGLSPGANRKEAQKQSLIERIDHFPRLPAVRHVLEKI